MKRDNLERVREICLALPETTEKMAWGEPTFRVRDKLFTMYAGAHVHGAGQDNLWCHAPPGAQSALVDAEPERFFVPPYVGKSGWVGLHLDLVSDEELELHVREAYCMVAPKKLKALLEEGTI